ncbi:hypothetical protein Tco_0484494 [Tanacetum coccineum]
MLDWRLLCHKRKRLFKLSLMSSRNSTCYKAFTISTEVPEIFMHQFWYTIKKVSSINSYEFLLANKKCLVDAEVFRKILDICPRVPRSRLLLNSDYEDSFCFLVNLCATKVHYNKHPIITWTHMHQPRRTLAAIINEENVDYPELIWGKTLHSRFYYEAAKEKAELENMPYPMNMDFPIPEMMLTEGINQSESYQICSLNIPLSNSSQKEHSKDDNIIPELDVALELGKSISLTKAAEEEAARDTSSVSKKMSSDPSQKLKGVQTLTPEEQIAVDINELPSKKVRNQQNTGPGTRGSSEGTGVSPGVPDEEKVTSKANVILEWGLEQESEYSEKDDDENIDWVDTDEEEEKDDDDDDKSIDLEKTDDEETVQDEFDEEMTNAEDADTGNGDEEITNTAKVDAEKTEVIAHIQSPSVRNVPVSVISEPLVFIPIPETPLVAPATTLLPPLTVSSISYVLPQTTTPIPTPPITTEALPLKEADNTTTLHTSLRSKIPSAVNAYLGSSLGDALQKVLKKHTEELIQKYPQQVEYKEMIEESIQANIINKVKNQLPKFLPKAVSDFATPVIQSTIKNALEKTPLLTKADPIRLMTSIKSYDALLNSLILNDDIVRGQADVEKVLRKRDRDKEDPPARPNQGKKTKRSITKESKTLKKSSTSKETSKGKSPTKTSKFGKSVTVEEPVEEPVFEMAFDDIEQTVDDVANDADQPPDDSTQTKDKALKQDWLKQPPRPPTPDPK